MIFLDGEEKSRLSLHVHDTARCRTFLPLPLARVLWWYDDGVVNQAVRTSNVGRDPGDPKEHTTGHHTPACYYEHKTQVQGVPNVGRYRQSK